MTRRLLLAMEHCHCSSVECRTAVHLNGSMAVAANMDCMFTSYNSSKCSGEIVKASAFVEERQCVHSFSGTSSRPNEKVLFYNVIIVDACIWKKNEHVDEWNNAMLLGNLNLGDAIRSLKGIWGMKIAALIFQSCNNRVPAFEQTNYDFVACLIAICGVQTFSSSWLARVTDAIGD